MAKSLPARPNLEHLGNQAKVLLKAHRDGDTQACERLRLLHRFSGSTDRDIRSAEVTLAEAQFVLAMEYGFKSWKELKAHVESKKLDSDKGEGAMATDEQDKVGEEIEAGLKKLLDEKPASQRDAGELIPVLLCLAREARWHGRPGIEKVAPLVDDEVLKMGLQHVAGDMDAGVSRDTLQAKKGTLILTLERRLEMIISIVQGINTGMNPSIVEERCRAFLQ